MPAAYSAFERLGQEAVRHGLAPAGVMAVMPEAMRGDVPVARVHGHEQERAVAVLAEAVVVVPEEVLRVIPRRFAVERVDGHDDDVKLQRLAAAVEAGQQRFRVIRHQQVCVVHQPGQIRRCSGQDQQRQQGKQQREQGKRSFHIRALPQCSSCHRHTRP